MGLMNTIDELAKAHGIENAYQFAKKLKEEQGVPTSTSRRLYQRREVYPDRASTIAICRAFGVKPGAFLDYVPDEELKAS